MLWSPTICFGAEKKAFFLNKTNHQILKLYIIIIEDHGFRVEIKAKYLV